MIETVTTYTCDKCKKNVPNGDKFYRLVEESVRTVTFDNATRFLPATDGIRFSQYDAPAIHLCQNCKERIMDTTGADSSFYSRGIN